VIAFCALEIASLITIAVASHNAPLVSDSADKPTSERADPSKRHRRPSADAPRRAAL
jgi:hypothetical protein